MRPQRQTDPNPQQAPTRRPGRRVRALAAAWIGALCLVPALAHADEYRPDKAGHPVRIVAYVLHPIGVILDVLIFRPAHWFVSLEGPDRFFGHERYED